MKLPRAALVAALAAALITPAVYAAPTIPEKESTTVSKLPEPTRLFTERIRKIEENQRRINNSSAFSGTGFHPTADNGIESDNFDGDLNAGDPGTTGWSMDADQAAFGELILRDGIIGNDSLTSPVLPVRLHADAQGFAVTPSWVVVMSVSVAVPAGFTKILIQNLACGVTALNSTGGVDYLFAGSFVSVGGPFTGWTIGSADVSPSGTGVAYDFRTALLTGLTPGSTITFKGEVSTSFATWAANSANVANCDIAGLWMR